MNTTRTRSRPARFAAVEGVAHWPAVETPDAKFSTCGPVYRVKVAVTVEQARAFYIEARDELRFAYPDETLGGAYLPVKKNKAGVTMVLAESVTAPAIVLSDEDSVKPIVQGDTIRVRGVLIPRHGRKGFGVNFRMFQVERIAS